MLKIQWSTYFKFWIYFLNINNTIWMQILIFYHKLLITMMMIMKFDLSETNIRFIIGRHYDNYGHHPFTIFTRKMVRQGKCSKLVAILWSQLWFYLDQRNNSPMQQLFFVWKFALICFFQTTFNMEACGPCLSCTT